MHLGYKDTPEDRQYPDPISIEIWKKDKWYDEMAKQGYTFNGMRSYRTKEERRHHRHYNFLPPGEKQPVYKYQRGVCRILSNEYHDNKTDMMDVYMAFLPEYPRKSQGYEILQQLILQDDYPTQDYIERHLLFQGMETDCIKKTKVSKGFGYTTDWSFPKLLRFDDDKNNDNGNQNEVEAEFNLYKQKIDKMNAEARERILKQKAQKEEQEQQQ